MKSRPPHHASASNYRNTRAVIDYSQQHFDAAHFHGLMAVYARPSQGRLVELAYGDRKQVVDFVRCSYLGLDNHPKIVAGAIDALKDYETLHWSCARTRLNFAMIADLEADLSELFRARVIAYSSVLAANMGALPILATGHLTGGNRPLMVFDRHAHVTLAFHKGTIATETQVTTIGHNDMDALADLCREHSTVVYVCDGVYSMGGSARMADLLELQERYGLFLYIDDAHGISLTGKHGEGFARSQIGGALGDRTIIAASLGKGFGASGGLLMLGTARQEELFRRFAVAHAFSASPNTAAIGAACASAELHRTSELATLQQRLRQRVELFDSHTPTAQSGTLLPIRTVVLGDEYAAISAGITLMEQGFYVSSIFFPTVARGRAGLRICLTAGHTEQEITRLCASIAALMRTDDAAIDTIPKRSSPDAG